MEVSFSFLDKEELWAVVRVCRVLRQLALILLLQRHGIATSQIHSGVVQVPKDNCFLIPMISRIHRIKKLTILEETSLKWWTTSLRNLPDILGAIPRIPEVVIRGPTDAGGDLGVARLLTTLSRGGMDPVVLVGHNIVRVSHFRRLPPIEGWQTTEIPAPKLSSLTARGFLFGLLSCIPLVAGYFVSFIINAYRFFVWLFQCAFRVGEWNQTLRIQRALGSMGGNSLRVETVCGDGFHPFIMATFSIRSGQLYIPRLPGLSAPQSAAFFASLDLKDDLRVLTIGERCAMSLPTLRDIVVRHRSLRGLCLDPGAIHSKSLAAVLEPQVLSKRITYLSLDAAYIPYILPNAPVVHLTISSSHNAHQLARAFATIASLPIDTPLRTLTMFLLCPWRLHSEVHGNAPMHGITHIILFANRMIYSEADARGFPRWLTRFPALVRVQVNGRWVPPGKRESLLRAITDAREAMNAGPWEGVEFGE
ncbi:hypothetical protein K438DRAFT_1955874 [Mycena galopus ATCC 62051]|nr:hypothetical protein K438DRAFT_1955874 [Mycena galopus ATCC 62051]